ncbi:MAG: glycosyltransferase family A protein [Nitrospirota bacterium]|nr:glycosyltransferase family A protein [Nitrospirota bacterium]
MTVVVPILNEADSLPQLLAALKAQTHRPKELIFSDAGSTDGSAALIEQWWREERWEGGACQVLAVPGAMPGAGRNAGVRAASSEWIAFIDAGIEPEPAWLERLCCQAQDHHSLAVFGVCHFSAEARFERAVCALSYGQGSVHSVIPASLFHRRVFDEIGFFPEHLRAAEDLVWGNRLFDRYGERDICPDAIVHYTHFTSSWGQALRKWKMAEYSSVVAGVRLRQQMLCLLGLPLVYSALFSGTAVGAWAFLVYVTFRGVIDPVRRSKDRPWWGQNPETLVIAPGLAVALDLAKLAGIVQGLVSKRFDTIEVMKLNQGS